SEAVYQNYGGVIPNNLGVLQDRNNHYYAVQTAAPVSGNDLKDAFLSRDENGHPAVGFTFTPVGANRFGNLTGGNIGKTLAVVLDGKIESAAQIETRVADSGIIRGGGKGFAPKETADLVLVLKSGALPASVRYSEEQTVGPS